MCLGHFDRRNLQFFLTAKTATHEWLEKSVNWRSSHLSPSSGSSVVYIWQGQVIISRAAYGRPSDPDRRRRCSDDACYISIADFGGVPDVTFDESKLLELLRDLTNGQSMVEAETLVRNLHTFLPMPSVTTSKRNHCSSEKKKVLH